MQRMKRMKEQKEKKEMKESGKLLEKPKRASETQEPVRAEQSAL